MDKPIKLKSDAYKFLPDGSVAIASHELAKVAPEDIAKELENDVPTIKASDISLSNSGHIIITNGDYRKDLLEFYKDPTNVAGDTNYGCGNNYKCKPQ